MYNCPYFVHILITWIMIRGNMLQLIYNSEISDHIGYLWSHIMLTLFAEEIINWFLIMLHEMVQQEFGITGIVNVLVPSYQVASVQYFLWFFLTFSIFTFFHWFYFHVKRNLHSKFNVFILILPFLFSKYKTCCVFLKWWICSFKSAKVSLLSSPGAKSTFL